jgi:hypothetical protein
VVDPSRTESRRDWIPIITTAITSLLGTSIITGFLVNFVDIGKPNVQILILPEHKDQHKVSFKMTNNGRTAATHLRLLIKAPENIVNYYNFSTENMTLKKVKPTMLEGNMLRFVEGNGSFVNIDIIIDAKPNIDYSKTYEAYATYDQGSRKGALSVTDNTSTFYIVLSVILIIANFVFIIFYRRKQRKKRVINIVNELQSDIKELSNDPDVGFRLRQLGRVKSEVDDLYKKKILDENDRNNLISNIDDQIKKKN